MSLHGYQPHCEPFSTILSVPRLDLWKLSSGVRLELGSVLEEDGGALEKLERVRALGADETINYKSCEEWGKRVLELTDGRGVDCTVEIGGPGTLNRSIQATRVGGHIALIGVLTGRAGEVQTAMLMGKNQRLQGLTVGSRQHQLDLVKAIEANGIVPEISDIFALENLADAFRHQESGDHFGKIAIEI